ncbi:DNA phosphorothioation-dependent restriction protein DptH [Texcoconibacillus texcoconensis]|uniref:DNA phosphorothioation-dependent restriction protein DptH n=1 Tax=Texcoconibacillus texcoconensis TaxID=1095777 RepID=A0A840QM37_9BACI|nr:DNA phosphorothioation-dependent restriction protein DptH [Texcoconibacillus texcoconensis]MBB5172442.1 DNA phosphorothioation-dependent restriction protein DptH [Texcoconibacillus texcoconensis]
MSNMFYKFIADQIIDYFTEYEVQAGDRFHVQFEHLNEVESLVLALDGCAKDSGLYLDFKWSNQGEYESFSLKCGDCEVLIASTMDGVTADFLTTLRNKVGTDDPLFENKAILFIHHTTLDSIIGGTVNMQQSGMPLSFDIIQNHIEERLRVSDLSSETKVVISFALEQLNDLNQVHSIFDYQELLEALHKDISKNDYKKLGLFYDTALMSYDEKTQIERLKTNQELFQFVLETENYGDFTNDLEKMFDENGVNIFLESDDWRLLEFSFVQKSHQNKEDMTPPSYVEDNIKETNEGLIYWECAEGDTKAKSRRRHIIIFNPSQTQDVSLEFKFDQYLNKSGLSNMVGDAAKINRKKINFVHKFIHSEVNFLRFRYKEQGAIFDFKIAIVPFEESFFECIKTTYFVSFLKKNGFIEVASSNDSLIINEAKGDEIQEIHLSEDREQANVESSEKIKFIKENEYIQNQGGEVYFDLIVNDICIPLKFVAELLPLKYIDGIMIYRMKRKKQKDFIFTNENRAVLGNQEFIIKDHDLLQSLRWEKAFIDQNAIALIEAGGQMNLSPLSIPANVSQAYYEYLDYFRTRDILPSMAHWDQTLCDLAKNYIEAYKESVLNIEEGATLTEIEKNLSLIGTVNTTDDIKSLKYSPLHPVNVMYQYSLLQQSNNNEDIPEEILKRLDPKYLTPYIFFENEIYKPVEQIHSPEWTYFNHYKKARYQSSTSFVSKVVSDKIKEFTRHYKYLFQMVETSPMKISLINLGDAKEVLQGIFEYYRSQINNKVNIDDLMPIEITIYQDQNTYSAMEEISFYNNVEEVERHFHLNLNNKHLSKSDLLNIVREKVNFYKRNITENRLEYAHITFYELEQYVDETTDQMDRLETGATLNGLFSSINSTFVGDSYRTGFGTKYTNDNSLVYFMKLYNSLALASGRQNTFEFGKTIVTAFSTKDMGQLKKIYEASHWVTFIEPKVDLSFFTEKHIEEDLLILHYSDQYSTSNHYDAITVTEKTKQFEVVIEEFLSKHVTDISEGTTNEIINLFNSLNGDWLLKMIGQNTHSPREKMSILSAVKFSLAFFAHSDIVWVPLSLEEVLRVSGAVGLEQRGGLFSAKNLGLSGPKSDDILLVGIDTSNEKLKVFFYPIEVKIGNITGNVIGKAKTQVQSTAETIYQQLNQNCFPSKVYRDFLMHLTIVSAKKLKLYNIWEDNDWDVILNESVRTKIFNDDYEISKDHSFIMGSSGIIIFEKENIFRDVKKDDDDILQVSLTEKDGYQYLALAQKSLFERLHQNEDDFPKEKLFWYQYKKSNNNVNNVAKDGLVNYETREKDNKNQGHPHEPDCEEVQFKDSKDNEQSISVQQPKEPMHILFGHKTDSKDPLIWYPTTTSKTMHTNTGIIGTMGTGKTQFTKSLIKQLHGQAVYNVNGTELGMLIFDYKGDYIKDDFVQATNATVYYPYHLPFNPLALYEGQSFKPLLPVHTASTIKETISTAFGLGVKQQQTINDIILESYEVRGIDRGDPSTWKKTPPTFKEVCNRFFNREETKEDSLYAALKQIDNFQLFSDQNDKTMPLFEMIDGVTVINLSGYDRSIQNLIVGMTLDSFYSQMAAKGHSEIQGDYRELTKMILVDEADNFISQGFKSLKNIMKEGREYGVGTILSTQFLSHFATSDSDYADYILTWIVHRVPTIKKKEVQNVFNPETQTETEQLMNKIRELQKHKSIVTNVSNNKYELMEDMAFWKLLDQ